MEVSAEKRQLESESPIIKQGQYSKLTFVQSSVKKHQKIFITQKLTRNNKRNTLQQEQSDKPIISSIPHMTRAISKPLFPRKLGGGVDSK
jgi:hypothetical protein